MREKAMLISSTKAISDWVPPSSRWPSFFLFRVKTPRGRGEVLSECVFFVSLLSLSSSPSLPPLFLFLPPLSPLVLSPNLPCSVVACAVVHTCVWVDAHDYIGTCAPRDCRVGGKADIAGGVSKPFRRPCREFSTAWFLVAVRRSVHLLAVR